MSYTVTELINGAYYTSGIVSREFQTVTGSQLNDGLTFLNDILADKTVEDDMIPYYQRLQFPAVAGVSEYFIPNLIEIETLVFFINTVRYQMTEINRRKFFGTSRANNIQSLPYTWDVVRRPGGATLFLYFTPDVAYPLEAWGLFRLADVGVNQNLESSLTTVNLGNPLRTGAGTLAQGQLVINGIDMAGAYATIQILATAITNAVPDVNAQINSNNFVLTSRLNIVVTTNGIGAVANTITFSNFSTLHGYSSQTFFPMELDRFYINYLKYALAVRLCNEFDYVIPPGVDKQLLKYEQMISKRSQKIDLRNTIVSTLSTNNMSINFGQVNLGRGWSTP